MPNHYLHVLENSFAAKKKKNPRYSLRAYASFLGVHPSALSRILTRRQAVSKKNGLQFSQKLDLTAEEQRLFLQSIAKASYHKDCESLGQKLGLKSLRPEPKRISNEDYGAVARLSSLAICELANTENFSADADVVGGRLGISSAEAEKAIQILLKHGLLQKKGNRVISAEAHLTAVEAEQTSKARRRLQKEILEQAAESLERDSISARGHYGMTMSIDASKLAEANKMILEFIEGICDFLGAGERTEVYQMGVQLFPLSRTVKEG